MKNKWVTKLHSLTALLLLVGASAPLRSLALGPGTHVVIEHPFANAEIVTPCGSSTTDITVDANVIYVPPGGGGSSTITAGTVEFYYGSTHLIASDSSSPFSVVWHDVPAGSYTLTAKYYDSENTLQAESDGVSITVKASAPTAGATGWWKAQNNATDTIGLNNGITHGSVSYAAGKVGQAFSLNGSSYIEVPGNPSISPDGAFTIETWIKFSSLNSSGGDCIVQKGYDCNCIVDWALAVTPSGKLRPHVNVNGNWYYFDCSTTLASNTWYHVAMVYDGAYIRGYVNGAQDGSYAASGPVATSTEPMKIGVYTPAYSYCYFPGLIDELTIYKRALSASELLAIYNVGSAGKCAPDYDCAEPAETIAGWWRGESNPDDQLGENDGTAHGSVAYAAGRVGNAFSLDGASYVEVPSSAALEPSGSFAVEAWVKFSSLNESGGNCIVYKGDDCNCVGDWALAITPEGKLRPHTRIDYDWYYFDCNSTLQPNTWYHVGMAYDGYQITGFVDGGIDGQISASGTVGTSSNPMLIGVYSPSESYCYFHGLIDEVSIYSGELTQGDIDAIFSAQTEGKCH